MIQTTPQEFINNYTHFISLLCKGEDVLLKNNGGQHNPRPKAGLFKDDIKILPEFFAPMDAQEISLWENDIFPKG